MGAMITLAIAFASFTGCKQDVPPLSEEEVAERELIEEFASAMSASDQDIDRLIDPSIGAESINILSSQQMPSESRQRIVNAMNDAQFVERTDTYAKYAICVASGSVSSTTSDGNFWIVERDGQLVIRFTPPKGR